MAFIDMLVVFHVPQSERYERACFCCAVDDLTICDVHSAEPTLYKLSASRAKHRRQSAQMKLFVFVPNIACL